MIAIGVTGTDTGVGKTVIACAIAAAAARSGAQVGVMKPVETGITPMSELSDAAALARAARSSDPREVITPYTFRGGVAPLVAARQEGVEIDLQRVDEAFRVLQRNRDVVVVEGAGGLLVPITPDTAYDGLFARWRLTLVVVAANRLGVLNHVRLTLRASGAAGLSVGAVVLNWADTDGSDPSVESNGTALRELLPGLHIVHFPKVRDTFDLDELANAADACGLLASLDLPGA